MRNIFISAYFVLIGTAAANADSSKAVAFGYASSGSCVASALGFTSKLEPVNPGVSWRITFNAVGSAGTDGKVTEAGQSVDSASFGAGPRMHEPAGSAYRDAFTTSITGPNADNTSVLHLGTTSGKFTAGPNTGLSFTVSDFELKGWVGSKGVSIFGSSESPLVQAVALSNGERFQRICTMSIILISELQ